MNENNSSITFSEIKEVYLSNLKLFAVVFLAVPALAIIFYFYQSDGYRAILWLDIVRQNAVRETENYDYDKYYRLEADKNFADTVVGWLKSPQLTEEVLREVGADTTELSLRRKERFFQVNRVSPQSVRVSYSLKRVEQARELASVLTKALNARTQTLNNGEISDWFAVRVGEPAVESTRKSFLWSVLLGVSAGFLSALIAVAGKHFLFGSKIASRRKNQADPL